MAKQIYILRHALTEPYSDSGGDFGRSLIAKGFEDAAKMGEKIVASGFIPEAIYCSTAKRTQQTLEMAWPHIGASDPKMTHLDELYLASEGDILNIIHNLPETAQKVMIIGHNPGVHHLVQILSASTLMNFSPATCAVLQSEHASWQDITPDSMKLAELLVAN
ncbi:MAG: histidine phosphatase family protein [Rickettsiales bacterium]|nr:histidine phosphatase family protein [Rickettsiales bacterium]